MPLSPARLIARGLIGGFVGGILSQLAVWVFVFLLYPEEFPLGALGVWAWSHRWLCYRRHTRDAGSLESCGNQSPGSAKPERWLTRRCSRAAAPGGGQRLRATHGGRLANAIVVRHAAHEHGRLQA